MLGEDVANELHQTLSTYLRNGLVLTKAGVLAPNKWKQELMQIEVQAKRVDEEEIASVLNEWIEQLNVLEEKRVTENNVGQSPSPTPTPQLNSVIDLGALGTAGFTMNGVNHFDFSGSSVRGAGDVNGDGFADVIIGTNNADAGNVQPGVSYVVFGSNSVDLAGSVIDLATLNSSQAGFTINGVNANDKSGYSVSGAGDVNKDGFADVIIGAFYATLWVP